MSTLTAHREHGVAQLAPPCRDHDDLDGPCPERAAVIVVLATEPAGHQPGGLRALGLCLWHRHLLDIELLSGAANDVHLISERGVAGRPPVLAH